MEPGRYVFSAYVTEFPDEMIEQVIRVERTIAEGWLSRAPVMAKLALFATAFSLACARQFALAGVALISGGVVGQCLRRLPNYHAFEARRKQAQLAFPSIVVELRSDSSLKPTQDATV